MVALQQVANKNENKKKKVARLNSIQVNDFGPFKLLHFFKCALLGTLLRSQVSQFDLSFFPSLLAALLTQSLRHLLHEKGQLRACKQQVLSTCAARRGGRCSGELSAAISFSFSCRSHSDFEFEAQNLSSGSGSAWPRKHTSARAASFVRIESGCCEQFSRLLLLLLLLFGHYCSSL